MRRRGAGQRDHHRASLLNEPLPISGEDDPQLLRRQLSRLQGVLVLSMLMTASSREEEILQLATTAVSSVAQCNFEGVYFLDGGLRSPIPEGDDRRVAWKAAMSGLGPNGGAVEVPGHTWAWAYPLRTLSGPLGYLLVTAEREPGPPEHFLLTALVQQTGVALANARLHAEQRAQSQELARTVDALQESLQTSERSAAIHRRLTLVAASGEGLDGIALAVFDLTGLPTAIEDEYGNLLSWAGPDRPATYPKATPARRKKLLAELEAGSRPIRESGRVMALANPREQVLGVLVLVDPDGRAGEHDIVTLEHGATVLSMELARLRSLAESELRLRRDLVEDLLSGTEASSAFARARALGYDLDRPHSVVLVEPVTRVGDAVDETFFHLVRRTARDLEIGTMVVARGGCVVVLAWEGGNWLRFHTALVRAPGGGPVRVGVGGVCDRPEDFPRSHRESELALKVQMATSPTGRVTSFDDLGLYQLLSRVDDVGDVQRFVSRWLGPLLEYDAARSNAELVKTLTLFLGCGGNHDKTAEQLFVHRSTLRYRLQRIREVGGYDLADPETVFNLQIATRAWQTLGALGH